jgi:serine/threonine protein kinase
MNDMDGRLIAHYRLDQLIGDGGMGTVYKAYDLNLERVVAIKVMHAHFARQPEFRARLTQEAKTAAQLDHPNIIRILDFGQYEDGLFIAMEYISGGNLRDHLKRLQENNKYLPLDQSLQIGLQIAEALDFAHRQGVIHRDVKPGNIILKQLSREEEPGFHPFRAVLTDFGLVKLLEGNSITRSGATLGTPTYMSPEQCEGLSLDGRSDLYSLGIVLYELVTNKLPFEFKSLSEAMACHLRGEMPPPAKDVRPDLPALVDALLGRALAKDPEHRFSSGRVMANTLRAAMFSLEDLPTQVMARETTPASAAMDPNRFLEGYRLRITTPGHEESFANLNRETITIGRNADNDIVLPAEGVSRYHARLQVAEVGWNLIDLGGINGTWINDRRLRADEAELLEPGSKIELGPYLMTFEGPPPTESGGNLAGAAVAAAALDPTPVTTPVAATLPIEMFLTRDLVSVEPGRQGELKVEVVNRGDLDDRVRLRVQGLPADWVSLPDTFVPVLAAESITIPLIILPPRRSTTPAGRQRFRIELVSQHHQSKTIAKNATLTVGTFEAFEVGAEPREVRLPGVVRASLRNTGNQLIELSVIGRDATGQIQFRGERGRIALKPGQAATVDIELESRQQNWFGGYETYGYELEVVSRSGARQKVMGRAQSSSVLPIGIAYIALFLVVFLCTIFALVWLVGGGRLGSVLPSTPSGPEGADALTATAGFATGTAFIGAATSQAATEAALTAAAIGDRDQDGLSDAQEEIVGTDPDNPDTDGDSLLDGEEVLTWGTNPLNRDTDADILIDGDEVRTYGTNPTNPDTDGDTFTDGVEIANGWDPLDPLSPLPTPTATVAGPTSTFTPVPPTTESTATFTPSPTDTIEPSVTPSATNTAEPIPTETPTPTIAPSDTPTLTPTLSPTETPTETPTPEGPPVAKPILSCTSSPPTINGVIEPAEWSGGPLFTFEPDGDLARQVIVYFVRDASNFYLAFNINDPTFELSDSLKVYFDANNNAGDPDTPDRFFQIARDSTATVRAGKGTNADADDWDATYTSDKWTTVVGEPGGDQWVVEMQIDIANEMPLLVDGSPFGNMILVLYGGSQGAWPDGAISNDLGTWQEFANTVCP